MIRSHTRKTAIIGVVFLFGVAASDATAQFGSISGRVTTTAGEPIAFANIIVPDTQCGAMSDADGEYVLPIVPAGRRSVVFMAMGYAKLDRQNVLVRIGENARLDVSLAPLPKPKDEEVPRWRPAEEPRGKLDTPDSAHADSILEAVALKAGIIMDGMEYEKRHLDPVRRWGAEFFVQFFRDSHDDSMIVRVVASALNVSGDPQPICGTFAFVHFRGSADVEGSQRRLESPALECNEEELAPLANTHDSLRFSYVPAAQSQPAGVVRLWCWFFRGENGIPWEETESVDLGILDIALSGPKK